MTKHDSMLAKGFIVFIVLLAVGIGLTVYTQKRTSPPAKASMTSPETTPSPIAAPKKPGTTVTDIHSSKADKKIILRATTGIDTTTTYEFFIADISGGNERPLFAKTLGPGSAMSLPFNAWDPSDTYVFVGEKVGGVPNYYVFKANGELFADGQKFINVGGVWAEKKIGYSIREATGWASDTLLIIYTAKENGEKGPSFWFEIPSTAIIQLAG